MTDKPTITQSDRVAAWTIRPDCFGKEEYANWQIGVYDGGRAIQTLANHREAAVAELQAEVERMQSTLRDICIHSNSDWAQVSSNPAAAIEKIHAIAINAYYGKDGLAKKEPVQ